MIVSRTSYGGAVAALFAFDYPHLVEKLVAICPVTRTPEQTPLYQRVFSGDYSVFAPETGKGLMQLLDALANKKVVIPEFIMNGAVKHYFNSERRSLIKTRKLLSFRIYSIFTRPKKNKIGILILKATWNLIHFGIYRPMAEKKFFGSIGLMHPNLLILQKIFS